MANSLCITFIATSAIVTAYGVAWRHMARWRMAWQQTARRQTAWRQTASSYIINIVLSLCDRQSTLGRRQTTDGGSALCTFSFRLRLRLLPKYQRQS
ncbi:hypothetical protein LINPERHAP1_LOCUS36382 [Linum perenne]